MFTGIIEHIGKIVRARENASPEGRSLSLEIATDIAALQPGESIAVEGVCLTVLRSKKKKKGAIFAVDAGEETLRKTTLGRIQAGDSVNLERPLKLSNLLGGHIVQGHVDAVGEIAAVKPEGGSKLFTFSHPPALAPYILPKGSVAIDGISLTVAEAGENRFSVSILPYTEEKTTLRWKKEGSRVNIEADVIAKITAKQVRAFLASQGAQGPLYQTLPLDMGEIE